MISSRIIYRPEWNLHIGHLPTLYYNNKWATENDGQCLLILDDIYRQDKYLKQFVEDLEWLRFDRIKVKPLSHYIPRIIEETTRLIRMGSVHVESHQNGVIQKYNSEISEAIFLNIVENSSTESYHVKFVGNCKNESSPSSENNGRYIPNGRSNDVFVIFRSFRGEKNWTIDYLISLIDYLEQVTHIVNLSKTDVLNYEISCHLYRIIGQDLPTIILRKPFRIPELRYQKTILDSMIEREVISDWKDPRLLTIAGLKNRGYPSELLHRFCEMGFEMESISINQLSQLVTTHYNGLAHRRMAILDPVRVTITNWDPKVISYIYKPHHAHFTQYGHYMVPLSGKINLERTDLIRKEVNLKYGVTLKFTNTNMDSPEAEWLNTQQCEKNYVNWISHGILEEPRWAQFYLYQGFYVGNHLCNLSQTISKGMVEREAEFISGEIYLFERIGYFYCKSPDVFYQLVQTRPYRN